ncbi:MAG: endonuclease MutS2 [Christensenellales bacterium]|jgi:DNA mismatch repair protein MutS2
MQERDLRVLEFTKIRAQLQALAVSEAGRERIALLEPSSDAATVVTLQRQTEEANTIRAYCGANPIQYFADVSDYLKIASVGGTLSPKALLDVAELLRASRGVRSAIVTDREDTLLLTEMASRLATDRGLEEEIFNAILSEDEIADRASGELYDIRRHIRIVNDRVRDKLNQFLRNPSLSKYLQDAIITMRNGRYVLPVKAECRQNVPGLIHDQSASGATLFIEPMGAVEAGNDLKQWLAKEQKEIERILSMLSAQVAPQAPLFKNNIALLAELDMIFAKAQLGRDMRAVTPKLNEDGRINIVRGRHPLIDPEKVVPIDLWTGEDFTTLVVTGPNTGGKTVTLKTVGLFALMTQAGLQVPAQFGTEMAIFDDVFADIGDEQSIEQSLSTFSGHMTNIVNILQNVTPKSLVLFDELGAGTDPTEGAALAMSILEHLLKMKATTLATTHYSELKAFALGTVGVENASVEFDVETLRPTYRLSIGVPGKSNAFEISRKLGLPEALIREASQRLSKDQIRFEDVIANAEYHRRIAEKERVLAEEAHRETQRLRDEAERARAELEEKRATMLQKAKDDAKKILARAQRESEQIIADLKKMRSGASVKEHELHALRAQMQGAIDDMSDSPISASPEGEAPKDLKLGETVELLGVGTKGTVLALPDAKGELMLQCGIMKMKVQLSQVRRAEPDKKEKRRTKNIVSVSQKSVGMECDVRGMTLDEATLAVDMYLDGAGLQALKTVSIIHGKGTGVLRAGIQDHLKKHPAVKEFRLGQYGEGEDGVTVVSLK